MLQENFSCHSEVHISKATLDALNGTYKVEPADGMSRNSLLKSRGIETFFVTSQNVTGENTLDSKQSEPITAKINYNSTFKFMND